MCGCNHLPTTNPPAALRRWSQERYRSTRCSGSCMRSWEWRRVPAAAVPACFCCCMCMPLPCRCWWGARLRRVPRGPAVCLCSCRLTRRCVPVVAAAPGGRERAAGADVCEPPLLGPLPQLPGAAVWCAAALPCCSFCACPSHECTSAGLGWGCLADLPSGQPPSLQHAPLSSAGWLDGPPPAPAPAPAPCSGGGVAARAARHGGPEAGVGGL